MNSSSTDSASSIDPLNERRNHPRYRFSAPVSVHTGDGDAIPAMIIEISERGLSAVLASPLEVGDNVRLEPIAASGVTAEVRHRVGKVHGFQFLQITEEQTLKLRSECRRLPRYPRNRMGI
jgi:hypothetical protein